MAGYGCQQIARLWAVYKSPRTVQRAGIALAVPASGLTPWAAERALFSEERRVIGWGFKTFIEVAHRRRLQGGSAGFRHALRRMVVPGNPAGRQIRKMAGEDTRFTRQQLPRVILLMTQTWSMQRLLPPFFQRLALPRSKPELEFGAVMRER